MKLQLVHMGVTQSGVKGLFTGGMLAMPLSDDQWELFNKEWEALDAYCARMGFEFDYFHHEATQAELAEWDAYLNGEIDSQGRPVDTPQSGMGV
jgi:hypothetical protein